MTDSSPSIDSDTEAPVAADLPPSTQGERRFAPLGELLLEYKYWTNPRSHTGLGDDDIRELADSIKAGTMADAEDGSVIVAGIRQALEVVQIRENGKIVTLVIDGQRRVLAAGVAGLQEDALVPVVDLEPEPVYWTRDLANKYLFRAFETVATRAGLSSYELAMGAKQLRESKDPDTGKDYTLARISQAVGRSESWVSKMLTAMNAASAKLMHRWKTGELTDEQFKDSASVKDSAKQDAVAERVVEARQSGDRGGARAVAKEQKEIAKAAARPAGKTEPPRSKKADANEPEKAVRGPQAELPVVVPPAPASPPPRKAPSRAVVEDILDVASKRPPTHDLPKGVILGIRWAQGLLDLADMPRAWHQWVTRVHATESKPAKPEKKKGASAKRKAAKGKKRR